jgi:DNA-binding LacI/PurR family transcriptional regulator
LTKRGRFTIMRLETIKGGVCTKDARIRDVAECAHVSAATVTRVINHSGYVSEKARVDVQRAIEELGYIPNRMASALKGKSTGVIGIVNPPLETNTFFVNLHVALDRAASQFGYRILSMVTSGDPSDETALLYELMGRRVDGIFFIGYTAVSRETIQSITNRGIPVVMLERPRDIPSVDKVFVNARNGSAAAAENFLSMGHTRVAYIGMKLGHEVETGRYEGFQQTLQQNGVHLLEEMTIFVERYTLPGGYEAMRRLLALPERPTAVFLASDILAAGALQCLYDARLLVPDDISIIGYDNTLASMSSPPISSIALPIQEMAKTAVALFLERKKEERELGKSVQIEPYFIDRHTVKRLV